MGFGGRAFNTRGFNVGAFIPQLTVRENMPWVMQVRNQAGVILHRLDEWYGAVWKERVNETGKLTFSLPLDNAAVQSGDIDMPNELWLYDLTMTLRRMFVITVPESVIEDGLHAYNVECEDVLIRLRSETPNTLGITTASTVEDIVDAIIAAQTTTSNPILKGTIDPVIGGTVVSMEDTENVNLLRVLHTVQETVGGFFFVDASRRLNWRAISTDGAKRVYQLPDNLRGYRATWDRSKVVNSVRVIGGIGGTRINRSTILSDTITDAPSISTFGKIHKDVERRYIHTKAQADLAAQEYLDNHKNGERVIQVPTVNTEQLLVDTMDEFDKLLVLGTPVRLKPPADDPLNTSGLIDTIVYGFKWHLGEPLSAELEFSRPRPDVMRKLIKRLRDIEDGGQANREEDDTTYEQLLSWVGNEGELVEANATGDGFSALAAGTAGQLVARKASGAGHEYIDQAAVQGVTVEVVATKAAATGTGPGFYEVTNDGNNKGLWYLPDGASAPAGLIPLPGYAAKAT